MTKKSNRFIGKTNKYKEKLLEHYEFVKVLNNKLSLAISPINIYDYDMYENNKRKNIITHLYKGYELITPGRFTVVGTFETSIHGKVIAATYEEEKAFLIYNIDEDMRYIFSNEIRIDGVVHSLEYMPHRNIIAAHSGNTVKILDLVLNNITGKQYLSITEGVGEDTIVTNIDNTSEVPLL